MQDHVLHLEPAEVGRDLGPIHSSSDGALSGPARLIHTQPPHSSTATAGARTSSRWSAEKSSRSGTPTSLPVVSYTQPWYGQVNRRAPQPCRSARRGRPRCWHTLWKAAQRAVALAGDHDGLAVALEGDPVARRRDLLGAPGEQPARAEHALALELEADWVGVRLAAHHAGAVVGDLLNVGPEPDRNVTACRNVNHLLSLMSPRDWHGFYDTCVIYNTLCYVTSMPKIIDIDERRQELTDAAARLIARAGLGAATMRDVAAEAGLTTGAAHALLRRQARAAAQHPRGVVAAETSSAAR